MRDLYVTPDHALLPDGFLGCAGALVESMFLVDPVTIHGRVLLDAGTVLGEAHIRALESLQMVLENQDIRVSLKCRD